MTDSSKATRAPFAEAISAPFPRETSLSPSIPDYMIQTYSWAYINPLCVALLDHTFVVSLILWGNHKKLMGQALGEIGAGQSVFQASHVYGSFTSELAKVVGPQGRLEVIDVVPVQVERCRRKLANLPQARVRLADAATPGDGIYDVVSSYFLLHEVPDDYKRAIVNALLDRVGPGGKAVFVDYHKPLSRHPLKNLMNFIFRTLEPYACGLMDIEISDLARDAGAFTWRKQTYFGGLYQKVVAERREPPIAACGSAFPASY